MQAQKVILGGNPGEAMLFDKVAEDGNNGVLRWLHNRVVSIHGQTPAFSWMHRPELGDFDLVIEWESTHFQAEKGNWIVSFDTGELWCGDKKEFESGVTFVTNTKSSALGSMTGLVGIADTFLQVNAKQVPNSIDWFDFFKSGGTQSTKEIDEFVAWLEGLTQHFDADHTGVRCGDVSIDCNDWVVIGMEGESVYAFDDRHYQMLYGEQG